MEYQWFAALGLACACVVVGIVGLLWPRQFRNPLYSVLAGLLVAALCLLGVNEIVFRTHHSFAWLLAVGLQLVGLVIGGLIVVGLKKLPALQGMLLALIAIGAGAGTLTWLTWQLDEPAAPVDRKQDLVVPALRATDLEGNETSYAHTDLGTPVAVYQCPQDLPWLEAELATLEAEYITRVIRVDGACPRYNCHGWTFTGGRYHVMGDQAELILRENRYYTVTDPRPGDVIAYYDQEGVLAHTGVVKLTDGKGMVVIESKWDLLGRYLHPPEVQPYSGDFAYFRTDRGSNLIQGLDEAQAAAQSQR
jgi:uncharacterized protein YacL (UPF0231 family)